MNVLVIGSGGREHALAWKLRQSPRVKQVFIAPGNAGTSQVGQNVEIKSSELDALLNLPVENRLGDDVEERLRTCVDSDCLNLARRGEFCNECQSRWADDQRAKARRERRSINVQRGF